VREYIERHREEIQKAALEALRTLDGSAKSVRFPPLDVPLSAQ